MNLEPETLHAIESPLDDKWTYFIDADGDLSRARTKDLDAGLIPRLEKVARYAIQREPGFSYFLHRDRVVRAPVPRGWTFLFGHNLDELHDCTSYFEPGENRYWVMKGKRARNDLRVMLGPRRLQQWVTGRAPKGWQPGDRVLIWEAAPRSRIVGAAEIVLVSEEPDEDGEFVFNVAYFTPYTEDGPVMEELRRDRLFRDASFLKAGPGGTLFPLTDAQGAELARRLGALHEPLKRSWPDAFGTDPVRWKKVPLFENCMFHLLGTDRLEALAAAGGGTEEIKARWVTGAKYLEAARRQKQRMLALFDHGDYFVNPDYLGLVKRIDVGKTGTTVTFDHFQKLPRKYLFSKLRKASDGQYVSPGYQRGNLPCQTPRVFLERGIPEPADWKPSVVAEASPPTAPSPKGGAGFGDAETNRQVELAAIAFVRVLYERNGWTVTSVERDRVGYDLNCRRKGTEEHAEVKGVAGTEVAFMITTGELERAKHDPAYVVHVVTGALGPTPAHHRWRGREFLESFSVQATQFRARLNEKR
ncbi:MAG: DUF3883 domain-containing protein [Polyangiaceae bacterium]|nr:DUF3883 domain-containing protein [Polyangiaceae bacterium]